MDMDDFESLDTNGLENLLQVLEGRTNAHDVMQPDPFGAFSENAWQEYLFSQQLLDNDGLNVAANQDMQPPLSVKQEDMDPVSEQFSPDWTQASSGANIFPPSPPYESEESHSPRSIIIPQNPIIVQSADKEHLAGMSQLVDYLGNNPNAPLIVIPFPKQNDPQLLCQMLEKELKSQTTNSIVCSPPTKDCVPIKGCSPLPNAVSDLKRKLASAVAQSNSAAAAAAKKVKSPLQSTGMKLAPKQSMSAIIPPNKIPITPLKLHNAINSCNPAKNVREKKEKKQVSGHNEVERRYREKMNRQFDNLRSLVFGHGAKSAKTQTLSKAIHEIRVLRKYTRALQQQNTRLRVLIPSEVQDRLPPQTGSLNSFTKAWNRRNGTSSASSDGSTDTSDDDLDAMLEPRRASSPESTPSLSPSSLGASSPPSSLVGDKSRAGICLFMFMFMVYMPFKGTLSSINGQSQAYHGSARRLFNADFSVESPAYAVVFYAVQILVSFLMFMWLFVKSEPTLGDNPKQEILFWECLNKAGYHINENSMEEAFEKLERALQLINKPLPLTILDRLCCLWWNLLCHLLNQFGISHFIHWLCKGIKWRAKSEEEISRRQLASRMATIAYQKVHELLITDPKWKDEKLLACVASINAINSADSLSFTVGPELTCRAYLNACLHLKARFPVLQRWFASYYHGCAHNIYRLHSNEISTSLSWAFHHNAATFILFGDWDLTHTVSPASDTAVMGDCLGVVAQQYRTSLLQSVLRAVVAPETFLPSLSRRQCLMEADNLLSMLRHSVLYRDDTEGSCNDTTSWWFDIVAHVLNIEHGLADKQTDRIPSLDEAPCFENQSWNSLIQAIQISLSVHHDLTREGDCLDVSALDMQLVTANKLLLESCVASDVDGHDYHELLQLMVLFCADITLKARYRLWERCGGKQASNEQLTGFNECIGILQRYSGTYPELRHKVRYYSTIIRIAVGTNPILTAQLLKRKGCRTSFSASPTAEDTEMAKTYVSAYKHLPKLAIPKASIGSIVSTLKEAGKILEKSNESYTLKECKQLLFQYSNLSCAHM